MRTSAVGRQGAGAKGRGDATLGPQEMATHSMWPEKREVFRATATCCCWRVVDGSARRERGGHKLGYR